MPDCRKIDLETFDKELTIAQKESFAQERLFIAQATPEESQSPPTSNLTCKDTLAVQIDGDHYKKMGLQPWEIIEANDLDYWEGAALKYLLRWRHKDGLIDLDKIIHYVQHIKALALKGHYGPAYASKIVSNASGIAYNQRSHKE